MATLRDNCIVGITANEERCRSYVENSVGTITAVVPHVGYKNAAGIASAAIKTGESVRDLILEQGLLTDDQLDQILDIFALTEPGIPAKHLLG